MRKIATISAIVFLLAQPPSGTLSATSPIVEYFNPATVLEVNLATSGVAFAFNHRGSESRARKGRVGQIVIFMPCSGARFSDSDGNFRKITSVDLSSEEVAELKCLLLELQNYNQEYVSAYSSAFSISHLCSDPPEFMFQLGLAEHETFIGVCLVGKHLILRGHGCVEGYHVGIKPSAEKWQSLLSRLFDLERAVGE